MLVIQAHRGRDTSRLLIRELEMYASDSLKLDFIVLEVGFRRAAAVNLYRTAGYNQRNLFGEYVGSGFFFILFYKGRMRKYLP